MVSGSQGRLHRKQEILTDDGKLTEYITKGNVNHEKI